MATHEVKITIRRSNYTLERRGDIETFLETMKNFHDAFKSSRSRKGKEKLSVPITCHVKTT